MLHVVNRAARAMCTYEVVAPSGVPQTKVVSLSVKAEVQLEFIASVVCLSLNFLHNTVIIAVFLMRQIDSWCLALTVDLACLHCSIGGTLYSSSP